MKRKAAFKKNTIENEFVDKITSLFPKQIVKVILFGSRAKGISKPGSDYSRHGVRA
jgi:predicted nucleotidyltransferase